MTSPSTRRQFVTRIALAAPAAGVFTAFTGSGAGAAGSDTQHELAVRAQATPTADQPEIGSAAAPGWTFSLRQFADPYEGEVSRPSTPPRGTRYVGAEVVITNGSDQPLDFTTADVRIRDTEGVEYSAGPVVGEEPKLVSQNLPEGERTRGWVWYAVPEEAVCEDVRFIGPTPIFRVALPTT
jgi:hypothetical protein